jgi:hypothetical protein
MKNNLPELHNVLVVESNKDDDDAHVSGEDGEDDAEQDIDESLEDDSDEIVHIY